MFRTIAPWLVGVLVTAPICACDKPGATEMQQEQQAREQANRTAMESQQSQDNAQAAAQQKIDTARAEFDKARADYRHDKETKLADLDKRIGELGVKANRATGKAKTDWDARMAALRAQRDAFVNDLQSLDTTPASIWDATKARVDREWDALDEAVRKSS